MPGARDAARAASATSCSSLVRSWTPTAHQHEPSWEELAFARDTAGHFGDCLWPPQRSYACTYCRREFQSGQGLGGHMNVHRHDRTRLLQCAFPDPADHHGGAVVQSQQQPIPRHQQQLHGSPSAVLISSHANNSISYYYNNKLKKEAVIIPIVSATTSSYPSDISTIIKNSKAKVIYIPATTTTAGKESHDSDDEILAERSCKRKRIDRPPEVLLPFFLQPPPSSPVRVEHAGANNKASKIFTSPTVSSSSSVHLASPREVDLELRLGSI